MAGYPTVCRRRDVEVLGGNSGLTDGYLDPSVLGVTNTIAGLFQQFAFAAADRADQLGLQATIDQKFAD